MFIIQISPFLFFILALISRAFAIAYFERYLATKSSKKRPSILDILICLGKSPDTYRPTFIDLKKVDNSEAMHYAKKNNTAGLFFYICLGLSILSLIGMIVYMENHK